jgi:hypothetical protein
LVCILKNEKRKGKAKAKQSDTKNEIVLFG